ncbi:hypothetical protein CWE04_11995 [Thomasclavelia cocleata]|uniref:Uncharacterized protein n=1 Tax=Thomasclavelia cocleata TaxID=69824 RepID=A0A1I0BMF2_9FIRM|nr:hypothetical protein [Thomasclavelia cocleata]MCR1960179.1 hypothetical protein [Thomasclavelia cocleata]NDO41847.1 hypothetical protein [Thomasclavelia cocleata]PJN79924.1 hypothetical protein CWE04_11995 [Thomasclavelia cocleata]SET08143.1 hypothetical protein SAMN04489758_101188 [Thomasclavelia cocleata]
MKVKIVRGAKDIDHDALEKIGDYDDEFELIVEGKEFSRVSNRKSEYWFKNQFLIKQDNVKD